jgi:hypothetical protein
VIQLIECHSAFLDKTSNNHRFRGMLYNSFPKDVAEELKKNAISSVPIQINGVPV